ncbi:hypothetical protein [Undibacterium squillarum]|uniref:hypothetical protein n=1 Tax=Undibacterium squillarum TaxID=1131567 RepID=UPI0035B15ABA
MQIFSELTFRRLRGFLLITGLSVLTACQPLKLVSPSDPLTERGMLDYATRLQLHLGSMAELAGKPEGSYEANWRSYQEMDAQLAALITRATVYAGNTPCAVQDAVYQRMQQVFGQALPFPVQTSAQADKGASQACHTLLLTQIRQQLALLKQIHRDADRCGAYSCLRPATAADARAITDQAIRAVFVIEAAKAGHAVVQP